MSLSESKHVYIVGIKGVANANLAVILQKMGKRVSGSDVSEEFITDAQLKSHNIHVHLNFSEDHITSDIDLVIYTGAHQGKNNIEVQTAQAKNIPVLAQAEAIGELTTLFKQTLAVCGCHGKTTTSSLLAHALIRLGANPSYLIGTATFDDKPAGDFNGSETFVIEADEYGIDPPRDLQPKFHRLLPSYAICMNIDYDHPDIYPSLDATKSAFVIFFQNTLKQRNQSPLILNIDDDNIRDICKQFNRDQYVTYGFSHDADLQISGLSVVNGISQFKIIWKLRDLGLFTSKLFGEKNISNVGGVILLLLVLGYSADQVKSAISDFQGAKRRFEHIAHQGAFEIFDDYAHHPAEIIATIDAAHVRFANRRIVVIFQPHTFSRTLSLKDQFVYALDKADLSLILPIFASAREPVSTEISSGDIAKLSKNNHIIEIERKEALKEALYELLRPGDIIFTMGAGDVYKLKNDIIEVCQALTSRHS